MRFRTNSRQLPAKARRNTRFRWLLIERLEPRACLAGAAEFFEWKYDSTSNTLILTGTNVVAGSLEFGNDELDGMFVSPENTGTIHYKTNHEVIFDTGITPSAASPIAISILGLQGDDVVKFYNCEGFPDNSIRKIAFAGGDGDDYFRPPIES